MVGARTAAAWGRALPQYNLTIDTGSRHGELDYGIANFASEHLMPTVQKVVDEASSMFSDELFFFGGDETACPYNEYAQGIATIDSLTHGETSVVQLTACSWMQVRLPELS